MTAPGIQVETGAVLTTLDAIAARAVDLTPVWQGPADRALRDMTAETFATEGGFIGERWAKLRPATLALKQRAGRAGMGILRMFDVLYRSLTVRSHPEQIRIVTRDTLTFGTAVPYAALHQEGWATGTIFGRARKGGPLTVAPRKVLPEGEIPVSTRETIEAAMALYVVEGRA